MAMEFVEAMAIANVLMVYLEKIAQVIFFSTKLHLAQGA